MDPKSPSAPKSDESPRTSSPRDTADTLVDAKTAPGVPLASNRVWRIGQLVAMALLGIAVGYGAGALRGRSALTQAQKSFADERSRLEAQHRAAASRVRALLARRDIHRALTSLEQRNFGTVEQFVRQAGAVLEPLGGDYAPLAEQLQTFRPTISDDVAGQGRQLMGIAQRLDDLIGQPALE